MSREIAGIFPRGPRSFSLHLPCTQGKNSRRAIQGQAFSPVPIKGIAPAEKISRQGTRIICLQINRLSRLQPALKKNCLFIESFFTYSKSNAKR